MFPFKLVALGGGLCLFSRWEVDHFILISLNNNWDPEAWSIEVTPGYNTTDWSLRGPIHICKRRHSYAISFTRSIDKLPFETIHKINLLCSIHTAEHVLNIYIIVLIWRPSDFVQVIQQTKLKFYHYLTYAHVALNFIYSVEHRTYYNKCLSVFSSIQKRSMGSKLFWVPLTIIVWTKIAETFVKIFVLVCWLCSTEVK